jgi:hypothetical protein
LGEEDVVGWRGTRGRGVPLHSVVMEKGMRTERAFTKTAKGVVGAVWIKG